MSDLRCPHGHDALGNGTCQQCHDAIFPKITVIEAEKRLEANRGICERCHRGVRYVSEWGGYKKICSSCTQHITGKYTYEEYMKATDYTGDARKIPTGIPTWDGPSEPRRAE